MALMETPSRIWRRIQAVDEGEPPSLPSIPAFDTSVITESDSDHSTDDNEHILPVHSTPAAASSYTKSNASTIRLQSSTSSTSRFATSIASRSVSAKSASVSRNFARSPRNSFDVSAITSLPHDSDENTDGEEPHLRGSANSVPESHLPPEEFVGEEDLSISDALESISRSSSPFAAEHPNDDGPTPKKKYDYSISLRAEPQASPFDKFRNVALRKPLARTRTPSLSRTTPSPASSPPNSTPRSNRSIMFSRTDTPSPTPGVHIPLPRSTTASPAISQVPSVVIQPPENDQDEPNTDSEFDGQLESDRERNSEAGDDREPTFSSASSDPSHPINATMGSRSLVPSPAFSSPAMSAAFTPTPAIAPRPRPRFNTPPPPIDIVEDSLPEDDEPQLTPGTRRKSFLLSVVNSNSNAMRYLRTPYARPRLSALPVVDQSEEVGITPQSMPMRAAFAGVTPRPGRARGRLSHPLAQTHIPDTEASDGEAAQSASPYDSAGERASFISTASSHDLAMHMRANTSYDPALGLGEHGGMSRFDLQKLNTYLHGLNHRLQDENKVLMARLDKFEAQTGEGDTKIGATDRRLSIGSAGKGRRRSAGGSPLGDVEEDEGAERLAEEKRELEEAVEVMQAKMEALEGDNEDLKTTLREEQAERARDKERWRERMMEVESGVAHIVGELEEKVLDAEKRLAQSMDEKEIQQKEGERALARAQAERNLALQRAENAENALKEGNELGGELKEANARITELTGDLRNAKAQILDLEDEIMASDRRIDELERDLKDEKLTAKLAEDDMHNQLSEMGAEVMQSSARIHELETELTRTKASSNRLQDALQAKTDELANALENLAHIDKGQLESAEEIQNMKAYISELEENVDNASRRIEILGQQLASTQVRVQQLETAEEQTIERMEMSEKEADRASDLARQMEEALQAAEEKMQTDETTIAELKGKLASLEQERGREKDREMSRLIHNQLPDGNAEVEEALEIELDEAHREIARLNTLLQQSPARKAIDKAKDAKIEILEQEREDLLERVKALRMTAAELNTPAKAINWSGISPIHRQVLSMSMRGPKTPGGPLRELSWLNNTTADPSVSPLLSEIARLQSELDRANESIDDKLDKLEDAGQGVVGLTRSLEDARMQISILENELSKLQRRDERRTRRLEKLRCRKCLVKIDTTSVTKMVDADESSLDISRSGLDSNPPTPPTRTSEALRLDLQSVNKQLDSMKRQWEDERRQLLGEKAALQDATNRMHVEVRNAKDEIKKITETEKANKREKANTQGDAERAKLVIAELEAELHSERARLRQMTSEQQKVQREKGDIARQLQRTETDINDVKKHLQKVKQENHELENELRTNTNIEQKARLLEVKVSENAETISQLRQERSLLVNDYKQLQRQFSEVSERANKLRDNYAVSQTSHDKRRIQLDLQLVEIEDLRRALSNHADELHHTEEEKNRIAAEKSDVARTVAALEADLKRVRRDAEAFGMDLKALRREKEKLQNSHKEEKAKTERAKKQAQTQIRLLNEQLDNEHAKLKKTRDEMKGHICAADSRQLEVLKVQHNKECKGLIVQIRYLKAKFTRESSLRDGLAYQKHYLLTLLSSFEASEKRILACISSIGYPKTHDPAHASRSPRSLKAITLAIIFIRRAKYASNIWREESASKQAVAEALQEVRRRRVTVSGS
ncbi:hypothetical protein BJ138DRAFT_1055109 [Hygrophoropsis aurantiaca]|uniref:Uncharacterized protein n=1 Tax=Hygrophoropsis aurantiaca TaxID=72124 RepID=A0ACB8AQM8_9AGAM|nr:hypothetical protein BJ138DRAFT_1055109 [Hygrophoropsis aurantiaca]